MITRKAYSYSTIESYEMLSAQLYNAIIGNDKSLMSFYYERFKSIADDSMLIRKREIAEATIRNMGDTPRTTTLPIDLLDIDSARANVIGAYLSLEDALKVEYAKQEHYNYANKMMFESQASFTPAQVLYREEQKQLTVSDVLDVSKYAIKVAQMLDPSNENYEKAGAAVTVFQGIEHTLTNQPDNGSPRKMLHLANDFLTSVVKSQAKSDEQKGAITGMSILVDLAIDFFFKGR